MSSAEGGPQSCPIVLARLCMHCHNTEQEAKQEEDRYWFNLLGDDEDGFKLLGYHEGRQRFQGQVNIIDYGAGKLQQTGTLGKVSAN